jgi:hypothetical protein
LPDLSSTVAQTGFVNLAVNLYHLQPQTPRSELGFELRASHLLGEPSST